MDVFLQYHRYNQFCRLCKSNIDRPALLSMSPFPMAAQYYPDKAEFERDKGNKIF